MPKKQIEKKKPSGRALDPLLPTVGKGRDEMIMIYAWSPDEALAAQEQWESRCERNLQGRGPFFRWMGAQMLKELYDNRRDEGAQTIIDALFVCASHSLPIPRWCEKSVISGYLSVAQFKAKCWDDVFGHPHPKGTHLGTKRQEREKCRVVYSYIEKLRKDDATIAIDGSLFEAVGKKFAIGGKTLTEGYYYRWKNRFNKY